MKMTRIDRHVRKLLKDNGYVIYSKFKGDYLQRKAQLATGKAVTIRRDSDYCSKVYGPGIGDIPPDALKLLQNDLGVHFVRVFQHTAFVYDKDTDASQMIPHLHEREEMERKGVYADGSPRGKQ